jgi:ATP-binding cassette subfamily B (MDR/TAP) protein 1
MMIVQPVLDEREIEENPKDPSLQDDLKPSTYMQLFHFADKYDWVLMGLALLFSLGNGVSIVFYSIPLKQLINAFSATQSKDEIVKATVNSVYGFLLNSAIVFVNCWLMTAAWTITSERQMNRARK